MTISSKTRKMLWGRSANRCAICKMELVMDETETDDESVIGDECHIVAREKEGPRGDSDLTSQQRDKFNNLILLCKVHHKIIDDQPINYSVEHLIELKVNHEKWVSTSLEIDYAKLKDDEIYMTFVDKWSTLCDLDNWKAWTSGIFFAGSYSLSKEMDRQLHELKEYIFSRIWPERYLEINESFENFRRILEDFLKLFHEYSENKEDYYCTEQFYKIREWDTDRYHRLLREYQFHVILLQDLVLELTRAGNYICDLVRRFLLPAYRIDEGLLIVESGLHADLSTRIYRTQYKGNEIYDNSYPGLDKFKEIRNTRDLFFGLGIDASDPEFLKHM